MVIFYEFYGKLGDGKLVRRGEERASVRSRNGTERVNRGKEQWARCVVGIYGDPCCEVTACCAACKAAAGTSSLFGTRDEGMETTNHL
jgi:hypothetical protein